VKVTTPYIGSGANVFIHRSQFPEAVRAELLRSLESREINHKFHYETPRQAQKWLALHEAHSPARTDAVTRDIYDAAFHGTARRLSASKVQVVGLGCGGGQKDVRLLELLGGGRRELSYVPCDVSVPLVLTAQAEAERLIPTARINPVVCDLAVTGNFNELIRRAKGEQRLVTFFGMIPNFEPQMILPELSQILDGQDQLLFSANMVPSFAAMRSILPQYDNKLTREWLMTLLIDLGIEVDDGTLKFTIEESDGITALQRFVAKFHFRRARRIRVDSREFVFSRGDCLRLFFSYRYTAEAIRRWLAAFGCDVLESWITPAQEEGVFLCRKARRRGKASEST
jgi:L-histidine Nalpha-methyltransferase